MSMKSGTSSRPLSVADIQRALRPRVYGSKKPAKGAVVVPATQPTIEPRSTAGAGGSPAPLLADMLDQARVHTAVLRTLLSDIAAEESAAKTRADDTRTRIDGLAPVLDQAAARGAAAGAQARMLVDATERATAVADRLTRLLAAGETLADDLRTRQRAEFDRQMAAFSTALSDRSAAALAEHTQRLAAESAGGVEAYAATLRNEADRVAIMTRSHASEAAGAIETLSSRIAAAKVAQADVDARLTELSEHAAELPTAIGHLEHLLSEVRGTALPQVRRVA